MFREDVQKVSKPSIENKALTFLSRFKCGAGCGVEFASRNSLGARIHRDNCPTRAFLASGWRPDAKSVVADISFFFRTESPTEGTECICSTDSGARLLGSWLMMCDKIILQIIKKTSSNGSRIAGKMGGKKSA